MKNLVTLALAATLLFLAQPVLASYMDIVLGDSPLAYYQFDETSGPTATDSSGNGNDGVYVGDPTLGAASIAPGRGGALGLDGVDDCVQVPDLGTLEQVSVEMLVKWTGDLSPQGYTSLYSTDGWAEPSLHLVVDGGAEHNKALNPGTPYGNTWAPSALDTQWHHVVAVLDAGTDEVKLYVDGNEVVSGTQAGLTARGLTAGFVAAWSNPWSGNLERHLPGVVDEVAFYGTALSAQQVAEHAAAVPEPSTMVLLVVGLLGVFGFARRR